VKTKNVSVGPSGAGRWDVSIGDRKQSSHEKQSTAIQRGRATARKLEAELTIRGRDGKVRSKDSYGRDPKPPKDREH